MTKTHAFTVKALLHRIHTLLEYLKNKKRKERIESTCMAMYVWIGCDAFCVVVSCYATGFFIFHIREKRAAESVGKRDTQKKNIYKKIFGEESQKPNKMLCILCKHGVRATPSCFLLLFFLFHRSKTFFIDFSGKSNNIASAARY